jgi:hypothetical protein
MGIRMTVIRLKDNKFFIEVPAILYPPATNTFWTEKRATGAAMDMSGGVKYYQKKIINFEDVIGFTIDPMLHTVTLVIRYSSKFFDVPFETQQQFDDGVAVLNAAFGVSE